MVIMRFLLINLNNLRKNIFTTRFYADKCVKNEKTTRYNVIFYLVFSFPDLKINL